MNAAARIYLDLLVARDYPEQEPAWQVARWYDLLWLAVPVVGFVLFLGAIEQRWKKAG